VHDRHIRVRLIRNVTLGIFSLTRVNQLVPIP
jgi:hypothetical protein